MSVAGDEKNSNDFAKVNMSEALLKVSAGHVDADVADDQTIMAAPLSDRAGNQVDEKDLNEMLGTDSEPTIGVLQNMSTIGMGGIGTVFSAQDPVLHREIAIKILRPAYRNQLNYVTGFIREARITSQIDHPNVIPVHRLGIFDDAGVYFTMKRVQGVTLAQILRQLRNGDENYLKTYTRLRLLEIFISICNGVAFAHSKGIIHRDLKPANIMVGDYGEVFIADWGLAIYREENVDSSTSRKIELGALPEDAPLAEEESKKQVSGTPAFMAPEQLVGDDAELDERTDIYALGTILYSIITWEPSPFEGSSDVTALMHDVMRGKFLRPRRRAPRRRISHELEAITLRAMRRNKADRYQSVIDLLSDVRNHIEKYPVKAYSPPLYRFFKLIRRRPLVPMTLLAAVLTVLAWNGVTMLQQQFSASSLMRGLESVLRECEQSRTAASMFRSQLDDFFVHAGKTETLDSQATMLRSRYLRSSNQFVIAGNKSWEMLMQLVQHNVGHSKLAPYFVRLLNSQVNYALAVKSDAMLMQIVAQMTRLPKDLQERIYALAPDIQHKLELFEQNQGFLSIHCNTPDVKITALALDKDGHVSAGDGSLVVLDAMPSTNTLKAGNYLITAHWADGRELRFPVVLEHDQEEIIDIAGNMQVPEDMVYVPGGNFIFGELTFDERHAKIRLPGFFISKYEVTLDEYLEFWKSLPPQEREEYRAYVDDRSSRGRKLKALWDDNGVLYEPYRGNMPVIGITSEAAEKYCVYMSEKSGLTYRLPTALEWEKAARGVDGREYVWGNEYFTNRAYVGESRDRNTTPVTVGSYPEDCSVYGIYDLTGNVRELVTNPGAAQYYTAKGASFMLSPRFARLTAHAYSSNLSDVGFRCVIEAQ